MRRTLTALVGAASTGTGRRVDDGTPGISARAVRRDLHDARGRQRGQPQHLPSQGGRLPRRRARARARPQTAAGLDDGTYVFQVTDPSGKALLSTDPARCRQFTVAGGVITGVVARRAAAST